MAGCPKYYVHNSNFFPLYGYFLQGQAIEELENDPLRLYVSYLFYTVAPRHLIAPPTARTGLFSLLASRFFFLSLSFSASVYIYTHTCIQKQMSTARCTNLIFVPLWGESQTSRKHETIFHVLKVGRWGGAKVSSCTFTGIRK